MAMGHDNREQPTLFITYDKLRGLGHPFYEAPVLPSWRFPASLRRRAALDSVSTDLADRLAMSRALLKF